MVTNVRTDQRWPWETWPLVGAIHPVLTEMRNQPGTLTIAIAIAAAVPFVANDAARAASDLDVNLGHVVDDVGATRAALHCPDVAQLCRPTEAPAGARALSNRDAEGDMVRSFLPIARIAPGLRTNQG